MDLIFPGNATSPTPFGLNGAGLWDEVEVCGNRDTAVRAPVFRKVRHTNHKISKSTSNCGCCSSSYCTGGLVSCNKTGGAVYGGP